MESLIIGLLVLAAMAVAAYLQRDRIRALFDRKPAGTSVPTITVPVQPTPVTPRASLETERRILEAIAFLRERNGNAAVLTIQDVIWRIGHGLNEVEIAYAKANGVYVAPDVVPEGPPVDLSSPDLSDRSMHVFDFNGSLSVYFLHPGGPAVLQVVGVSGQPLTKASDSLSGPTGLVSAAANRDLYNSVHEAFRGKLPAGQYQYRFESAANGRVGAQYQATN
jgi:hypothetical protein